MHISPLSGFIRHNFFHFVFRCSIQWIHIKDRAPWIHSALAGIHVCTWVVNSAYMYFLCNWACVLVYMYTHWYWLIIAMTTDIFLYHHCRCSPDTVSSLPDPDQLLLQLLDCTEDTDIILCIVSKLCCLRTPYVAS